MKWITLCIAVISVFVGKHSIIKNHKLLNPTKTIFN